MPIEILDVEMVLNQQQPPLTLMSLHALSPEREPYRAMLLQPSGIIEANEDRVGHEDVALGHALCNGFLLSSVNNQADLVVAPEYCIPWTVVDEIVTGQYRPPLGAIWVLGCESISPVEIQLFAQRCNASGQCIFHQESLDARQVAQKRYVDPLLYVFWALDPDGQPILFFLSQFKTVACRDYRDIEETSLCLGRTVYAFNRGIQQMSLVSIICSDAFNFAEHINQIHNNCLLIHIQLNPKPAHSDYAAYRTRLCAVGTNSNVELLCLNWAKNIKEAKGEGRYLDWNNVAGSAWYAPPAKFSADDRLIDNLHQRGLYYCLLERRWHSFFLNYESQIIQLQKQKLAFFGEQALAPKSFVAVEERWGWDITDNSWKLGLIANDGFGDALTGYHAITEHLQHASSTSPLAVERAIEILLGPVGSPASWYTVKELDAVHLDRDEESIRRVTVHQDEDLSRPGSVYRMHRLQRAHDAIGLAQCAVPWPAPVRDLASGFKFSWKNQTPHYNIEPDVGGLGSAALVYLSDQATDSKAESAHQKLRQSISGDALTKAIAAGKSGEGLSEAIIRAQDRLCIVFRRDNRYFARGPEGTNFIDTPGSASPVDFSEDRS